MAAPAAGGLFTEDGARKREGEPKKLAVLTSGGDSAGSELDDPLKKRDLNGEEGYRAETENAYANSQ